MVRPLSVCVSLSFTLIHVIKRTQGDVDNLDTYEMWLKMFRGELSISTFEVKVKDESDGMKEIKGKRLEVRILGHNVAEKSYGGLKSVVTYQLSWQFWKDENDTSPLTGAVQRRYSDFVWLRDVLRLRYRGMLVPPIPAKKLMNSAVEFLDQRMGELQFFLNEIVANPFLMSDHSLALFLRHGADLAVGGNPPASAKQEWSDIKSGLLTDERNANLIHYSAPMRLKVDASLGKATTSSRCSPGYRAWASHVDSQSTVPGWDVNQEFKLIDIDALKMTRRMQEEAFNAALKVTECSEKYEESVTKLAKKHAAAAQVIGHDPLKSEDEKRLANLSNELCQITRLMSIDGWASAAHDSRTEIQITKRFVLTALDRSARITNAMIELLDQHRYTLAGLNAVQKRLAKNKKTQAKLEADPTGSKGGFASYLPGSQDLEGVTESILQDSRAVSTAIAIAGREIKAIWWIETKRYQTAQSILLKKSMSVYAAMRVQLCKDAKLRWSTMVKNLKCDTSAQFALTGTISEPSAALVLPVNVEGLPQRHRADTDAPSASDMASAVRDSEEKDDDEDDVRHSSGGVSGAIQSMADDEDGLFPDGDAV